MKNIGFLDHVKCILKNECDTIEEHKIEVQKKEIQTEDLNQSIKSNFHLFSIDELFAN